jgi:hypothetical protein
MSANGYDEYQPVVLATWPGQEEKVIIDGHTRWKASLELGIDVIYFVHKEFEDEMAALKYAMGLQSKRRTTSDGALYRLCERYDVLSKRGGDRRSEQAKSKSTGVVFENRQSESSGHKTGSFIGCNYKKVERIRKIRNAGSPKIKDAVRNDRMTINKAYNLIMDNAKGKDKTKEESDLVRRKAAKVLLNKKNLAALSKLEGSLEDHVNTAVEQYMARLREMEAAGEQQDSDVDEQKPRIIQ